MKGRFLMRVVGVFAGLCVCLSGVRAQEIVRGDSVRDGVFVPVAVPQAVPSDEPLQGVHADFRTQDLNPVAPADSVPLFSFDGCSPLRADGTIGCFPEFYYGGGMGLWNLHEGFNASLNMSVCASFGRHRFPGVGFGTGISAMYAHRLTERLMMAVGGFYDRMSWGAYNENRVGANLMLGYRLTDKVSVYAYASKAFTPSAGRMRFMPPMCWADRYRERFGGMIHVKVSDAMSFSVSVEEVRR